MWLSFFVECFNLNPIFQTVCASKPEGGYFRRTHYSDAEIQAIGLKSLVFVWYRTVSGASSVVSTHYGQCDSMPIMKPQHHTPQAW